MSAHQAILEEDASLPLVHLAVAFKRGATIDPEGKEGASRLLLRLMRRSVQGIAPEALDEKLDALGATLSTETNRASANIVGGCISRSTEEFLSVVETVIKRPDFSEDEFARLVQETQAGWTESLDNDSAVARRFFTRALFAGHDYGKLMGGTPQSLQRISLGDLKDLYEEIFRSDCAYLSLAGEVSQELADTTTERLLGQLPGGAKSDVGTVDPPGPRGRHLTFVDKPERTQTQILIGCLGTHPRDEDHTDLFVGHTIFGGTFSARLSQEVRGKRGWSYGAYSDLPFDRNRQGFSMWTFPQASDAADCIRLELELLQQLIERGVTEEELEAAKNYLQNSHVFSIDTAAKRASIALDRLVYDLPEDYHRKHLARIAEVTTDDVNRALKRRLSHENLEITVLGTFQEIGIRVQTAIENLVDTTVVPFDRED